MGDDSEWQNEKVIKNCCVLNEKYSASSNKRFL